MSVLDKSNHQTTFKLQVWLGCLGLIPFVGLALWLVFGLPSHVNFLSLSVLNVLKIYAFGIFSFLCGVWWKPGATGTAGILASNMLFLLGFFSFCFLENYVLIIFAGLFALLFILEWFTGLGSLNLDYAKEEGQNLTGDTTKRYRTLRFLLTLVVMLSLVVAEIAQKI